MRLVGLMMLIAAGCGTTSAPPAPRPAEERVADLEQSDCDLPERTYTSRDPSVCGEVTCPPGHGSFEDACGCGCIAP